jgi:protein-S-isoprenylcysteine O-methyltransferase Ste14
MASEAKDSPKPSKPVDLIQRGIHKRNNAGILTFLGIRPVETFLQYGILAHGLGSSIIHSLGLETLPAGPANTGTVLDALSLSPYRLILFGMTVGQAVKQISWLLGTSNEEFLPSTAVMVTAFNGVFNSINNLLFTCSLTSASLSSGSQFPQVPLLVGSALYVLGIFLESGSEIQRKKFKDDPKNKGKVCTVGLWSFSRHINYFGYTAWRVGYALAAGGWSWAAFTSAWFTYDFVTRGVPTIESYCAERVGLKATLH